MRVGHISRLCLLDHDCAGGAISACSSSIRERGSGVTVFGTKREMDSMMNGIPITVGSTQNVICGSWFNSGIRCATDSLRRYTDAGRRVNPSLMESFFTRVSRKGVYPSDALLSLESIVVEGI